jgi:dTDP-4-dehydrorhamnose reductase
MNAVKAASIDIIVNCAAYTNVDKAESDEATAELINSTAVGNLARAMKEVGGTLFHVSTDYVFGSEGNTPRTEDMPLNPLGVYGKTKLHGEQAIEESGCKALIFRTAWLYSEFGNNFLKTMLRLTAEREQLNVVFDQVGTPTYAGDLALAIFSIIEAGVYEGNEGIYHFSNEGVCSWYDFAVEIARAVGNTKCQINPCRSKDFPTKATRPSYSVLDKDKIKRTFGIEIPQWRESMFYCLKRLLIENK